MTITKTWNGTSYSIPETGEFNWQSLTSFLAALGDYAQATTFQKIAVRVATTSPVTISSATDCILVTNLATPGPVAVTLPPGSPKQVFFIVDGKGDAATNNVTITPDGAETINGASSYVMDLNRGGIGIIYTGSGWTVFGEFANASGSTSFIPRSKIAAGTASHVIINDGSGFLSSEAQLASSRGGTGVNNAGTLTYGANNVTLTTAGATTLTLPLTGTLATLAGSEQLSNKELVTPTVSGGSIDVHAPGALAIGASVGANNITLGGATSTTIIPGNLTIQGTTTTVDTQTLDVKDKNVTVNKGGNDATSEGAGLTIDRTGTKGSIIYKDASASKFALGALGAEVDVVDLSSSQILTNKTLSGGTVSNSAVTASSLTVSGAANLNGGTTLGDAAGDALTINSSAVSTPNGLNFDSNTLVIDATNNRVGVGTATPSKTLEVAGEISCTTANVSSVIGTSTSLIIQPNTTSTATVTISNNPTISGEQKQILIGPNAVSGSTTLVTFGSSTSGAINRYLFNGKQAVQIPAGNSTTDRPASPADGMIRYNSTDNTYEGYSAANGGWSPIGGGGAKDTVTQNTHGFTVGDILYLNGSTYTKAKANAANTAEVVGIVSKVIDTNNFELTLSGYVEGILSPASMTVGGVYFLSDTTDGLMTLSEPTTIGYVSVPLGVAVTTTSIYFQPKRGSVVGSANARTQITLANNATTTVQNVSTYDAGELAGWVSLVNSTAANSLRFYVQAPFAKKGNTASPDYFISPSYVGDTPPVGFSMSITAAGLIQVTMPLWSGYQSAVINFALNAPAVGTNFPLAVGGDSVTGGTPVVLGLKASTSAGLNFASSTGSINSVLNDSGYFGINTTSFTSRGKFNVNHNTSTLSTATNVGGPIGQFMTFSSQIANVNNSTVDLVRFLDPSGTILGATSVCGILYFYCTGVSGVNAVSGAYNIYTTGNGTAAAILQSIGTVQIRGTNPTTSVQIANDTAGGQIKITITFINNSGVVTGGYAYASFSGLFVG